MMRGLLGLLIISGIALAPATSWPADEAPSKDPAADSPSEPSESERRPLRSRLLGATPEERERLAEERKRLSAIAAANGTDPTAIIGFYQLSYGHDAFTHSLRADTATAIAQVPLTPNWLIKATLPYIWADLDRPGGFTTHGTGDLTVRMGGRLYASQNVALFVGTDATFPTAANNRLGFGKYALGPGVGASVPLPRLRSLLLTVVQDFNSVGGDPSRTDLHYMQVQTTFNTIWSERWWTSAVGIWSIDWNNNRKTTMNLLGEVGHGFDEHWKVFVRPGVGVVGRETFLGLDWTVEAGVRWTFKTPLIPETFFEMPLGK